MEGLVQDLDSLLNDVVLLGVELIQTQVKGHLVPAQPPFVPAKTTSVMDQNQCKSV